MTALNVHRYGPADGQPVLALHGVTGHGERWKVLADALPELALIAVDLRGHGRSPWTPPWGFSQHVTDVIDTLDDLGLDRATVLGHSFGGAIAVHLARAVPDRVERLVLIDPAIGLDPDDMLDAAISASEGESYPDRDAAHAERARRWEGIDPAIVDAEIEAHLMLDGDRLRYRYSTPAVVTAWSEMARPAVIPPAGLRTLLLPAAKADFVDQAWVTRIGDELGDLLTVTEMDTGHMVHLEQPAAVADAIRAFLGA